MNALTHQKPVVNLHEKGRPLRAAPIPTNLCEESYLSALNLHLSSRYTLQVVFLYAEAVLLRPYKFFIHLSEVKRLIMLTDLSIFRNSEHIGSLGNSCRSKYYRMAAIAYPSLDLGVNRVG